MGLSFTKDSSNRGEPREETFIPLSVISSSNREAAREAEYADDGADEECPERGVSNETKSSTKFEI